jgi:hypothetical protein
MNILTPEVVPERVSEKHHRKDFSEGFSTREV